LNILVSQTQTAAIVYFELKEQLEKEFEENFDFTSFKEFEEFIKYMDN